MKIFLTKEKNKNSVLLDLVSRCFPLTCSAYSVIYAGVTTRAEASGEDGVLQDGGAPAGDAAGRAGLLQGV